MPASNVFEYEPAKRIEIYLKVGSLSLKIDIYLFVQINQRRQSAFASTDKETENEI